MAATTSAAENAASSDRKVKIGVRRRRPGELAAGVHPHRGRPGLPGRRGERDPASMHTPADRPAGLGGLHDPVAGGGLQAPGAGVGQAGRDLGASAARRAPLPAWRGRPTTQRGDGRARPGQHEERQQAGPYGRFNPVRASCRAAFPVGRTNRSDGVALPALLSGGPASAARPWRAATARSLRGLALARYWTATRSRHVVPRWRGDPFSPRHHDKRASLSRHDGRPSAASRAPRSQSDNPQCGRRVILVTQLSWSHNTRSPAPGLHGARPRRGPPGCSLPRRLPYAHSTE